MEHDSGPMPHNELAQEAVDALRCALEEYARHPAESAPELRAALHELAREARLLAMPPEELLLLLKRTWRELPDVMNAPDQTSQTRVLQNVVTMCIKEYFAD
jgi:hypothetical protein